MQRSKAVTVPGFKSNAIAKMRGCFWLSVTHGVPVDGLYGMTLSILFDGVFPEWHSVIIAGWRCSL